MQTKRHPYCYGSACHTRPGLRLRRANSGAPPLRVVRTKRTFDAWTRVRAHACASVRVSAHPCARVHISARACASRAHTERTRRERRTRRATSYSHPAMVSLVVPSRQICSLGMSVRRSSKRGLVEGPAPGASEADRGEVKRVRKAPPSSSAAEATAAEEKRLKADTAKAKAASRRDAFDKSPSTEGLWAWGKDCVGWKVPIASMHKRDVVLDALVAIGAPVIKTKKGFAENWRRHLGIADKKATPPSDADEAEDDEELDDEADAAEASRAAAEHRAQIARDKAASAAAAAKKSSSTATTGSNPSASPLQLRSCTHCTDEQLRASLVFRCDACHMRSDLPFDAQQNVYFRSAASASASSGQSDTETALVRTPKEALSRRDKELERLAEEGAPFPRFDDAAPMSSAEALEAVRDSMWATLYADPSASLIKLVRSGKLTRSASRCPDSPHRRRRAPTSPTPASCLSTVARRRRVPWSRRRCRTTTSSCTRC